MHRRIECVINVIKFKIGVEIIFITCAYISLLHSEKCHTRSLRRYQAGKYLHFYTAIFALFELSCRKPVFAFFQAKLKVRKPVQHSMFPIPNICCICCKKYVYVHTKKSFVCFFDAWNKHVWIQAYLDYLFILGLQ